MKAFLPVNGTGNFGQKMQHLGTIQLLCKEFGLSQKNPAFGKKDILSPKVPLFRKEYWAVGLMGRCLYRRTRSSEPASEP